MMRIFTFIFAGILLGGCSLQSPQPNQLQLTAEVSRVEFDVLEPEQAKRVIADYLLKKVNKDQYYVLAIYYSIEQSHFVDELKQLVKDIGLDANKVNYYVKDEQQKKDFKIEIKTQDTSSQECPPYNIFNQGTRPGCVVEINRWNSMVEPESNLH